jgi:hypothetical protein
MKRPGVIAQIVETSSVLCIRRRASLETKEGDLAENRPTKKSTRPCGNEGGASPDRALAHAAVLGSRHVWNHDGGPAIGAGADVGLGTRFGKWFVGRARLVFEYRAPQTITAPELDASFGSTAVRAGSDGGVATGPHAFLLGLGAGVDFNRVTTDAVRDPSLMLAPGSSDSIASLRGELRYELTIGQLWVAGS